MAQTAKGQKYNRIPSYVRQGPSGPIVVPEHLRSNPTTSKGADKGKGDKGK